MWSTARRRYPQDSKQSPFSRLGPLPGGSGSRITHTGQGKRFAGASTKDIAHLETPAPLHTYAASQGAARPRPAPSARQLEPLQAPTPLRRSQFEIELAQHPDKAWISWLLDGIKHGVRIGYFGPRQPLLSRNLTSANLHPHIITEELQKEVSAGRIIRPFATNPLPSLHCSGLGAVPKKNGKWRVIMHLSAPRGVSVNDHISKEEFSLSYTSIDKAVELVTQLGRGALMAKADLQAAFRMIPVHPEDWDRLGIYWQSEYYIDTRLPFGLRSAPFLFNQYAEALLWVLQNKYSIPHCIHYLDDYFFAATITSPSFCWLVSVLEFQ